MQSINALFFTCDARNWLTNSRHPRILHVFDHACNLINDRREVLSVVTPQIGNGPFNLVIEDDVLFPDHLNAQSQISISANQLNLGNLTISTEDAQLWSPRPHWEMLHAHRNHIINQLTSLPIPALSQIEGTDYQFPNSLLSALANANLPSSLAAAKQLAGLGIGLTPAGDDFMMGAVFAAWIIHPLEVARILAKEITDIAAPLTTSLSAAWLRSAGKGEAGILWHDFFDALRSANTIAAQGSMNELLAVGHTSGADALAGFLGVIMAWATLTSQSTWIENKI